MLTRKQIKLITTLLTIIIATVFSVSRGDLSLTGVRSSFVGGTEATSSYAVLRVVDGDTIDIEKDGAKIRLRLIGINSPESVDPRRPVECFGKEASKHASTLLTGTSVTIESDASQGALDKYGRTLAYVILSDGKNFNEQMIRDGYAYEYTYHIPYKYQSLFKEAERDAQSHARGLWATSTCSGKK